MVSTSKSVKNFFRVVQPILLEDIQNQAHGSFLLQEIGNVIQVLRNPLTSSALLNLAGGNVIEIQIFHDKVHSYMIYKSI